MVTELINYLQGIHLQAIPRYLEPGWFLLPEGTMLSLSELGLI